MAMDLFRDYVQYFSHSVTRFPYNIVLGLVAVGGTLCGAYSLLRHYVAGRACTSRALLDGKIAVITGANSGIGKEMAIDLARRNARVILACRSVERAEKAVVEIRKKSGRDNVVFRQVDLASLESVRLFAAQICEQEPKVDILINNAGLMGCPYMKTCDGFEYHFGVNHLGHFLLTNLLLEQLKKAPAARVVTISSSLYKRCPGINFDDLNSEQSYNPLHSYSHSKLANILFTRALARRLRETSVTANVTHTAGMVRTELGRYTLADASFVKKVVASVLMFLFLKTPSQGAQPAIYCAVSEDMEGVSGKFIGDCKEDELKTAVATDNAAGERLWRVSAKLVGVSDSHVY